MYVPILSIDGVVVDWFVPPESSIHSRLWSDYILKSINQWWMNKWARLSTADRERIQQCVSDAISAGQKVIHSEGVSAGKPLPGEIHLHFSESLLIESDLNSTDSVPADIDDFHQEEEVTITEIPHTHPRGAASHVELFPSTYLNTSDEDISVLKKTPVPQNSTSEQCPCIIQYDNAPFHTSFLARKQLHQTNLCRLPHPPYSPDLSICDFFYFGSLLLPNLNLDNKSFLYHSILSLHIFRVGMPSSHGGWKGGDVQYIRSQTHTHSLKDQ